MSNQYTYPSSSISCLACRTRKVRCSHGRPKCANCLRRGDTCSYDAVVRRRGPDRRPGGRLIGRGPIIEDLLIQPSTPSAPPEDPPSPLDIDDQPRAGPSRIPLSPGIVGQGDAGHAAPPSCSASIPPRQKASRDNIVAAPNLLTGLRSRPVSPIFHPPSDLSLRGMVPLEHPLDVYGYPHCFAGTAMQMRMPVRRPHSHGASGASSQISSTRDHPHHPSDRDSQRSPAPERNENPRLRKPPDRIGGPCRES